VCRCPIKSLLRYKLSSQSRLSTTEKILIKDKRVEKNQSTGAFCLGVTKPQKFNFLTFSLLKQPSTTRGQFGDDLHGDRPDVSRLPLSQSFSQSSRDGGHQTGHAMQPGLKIYCIRNSLKMLKQFQLCYQLR
jgi:hypothetical protein